MFALLQIAFAHVRYIATSGITDMHFTLVCVQDCQVHVLMVWWKWLAPATENRPFEFQRGVSCRSSELASSTCALNPRQARRKQLVERKVKNIEHTGISIALFLCFSQLRSIRWFWCLTQVWWIWLQAAFWTIVVSVSKCLFLQHGSRFGWERSTRFRDGVGGW